MRTNLISFLDNAAPRGDETAFAHRRGLRVERWSYQRLRDAAFQFARELDRRGIHKGERVLLWGENCAEWVAAFFGCLARGVIIVPLDVESAPDFVVRVQQQVHARLLVHSGDEEVFECVLLPYEDRVSCCISSQVGCPMACTFCATGLGGFDRNLSASEIVGQYLMLQRISPRRISHVVFMGTGAYAWLIISWRTPPIRATL